MRLTVAFLVCVLAGCSNADPSPMCGDGTCAASAGESCTSCAVDCGSCVGCGDGTCAASLGESCVSCAADCGACGACGDGSCAGGETCSTCPDDCGSCPTSCSPATCSGCCDGDACVGGGSPAACGAFGNACVVCAPGFLCVSGGCAVDPASRWNVVLEYVEVSSTYYTGEAWDALGGAPDPLVEVYVGSETATPTRSGSSTDVFSVTYDGAPTATNARADALQSYLGFEVMDEDVSSNDRVGGCRYTGLADAVFSGGTQTLDCPRDAATMNSGFTLYWHLERF